MSAEEQSTRSVTTKKARRTRNVTALRATRSPIRIISFLHRITSSPHGLTPPSRRESEILVVPAIHSHVWSCLALTCCPAAILSFPATKNAPLPWNALLHLERAVPAKLILSPPVSGGGWSRNRLQALYHSKAHAQRDRRMSPFHQME